MCVKHDEVGKNGWAAEFLWIKPLGNGFGWFSKRRPREQTDVQTDETK